MMAETVGEHRRDLDNERMASVFKATALDVESTPETLNKEQIAALLEKHRSL